MIDFNHEKIRAYYDGLSLESTNKRRADMKLEPIDKLGGFTRQEKIKLGIPLSEWEHDGYKWSQIVPKLKMVQPFKDDQE